jgi:hypothetical protein
LGIAFQPEFEAELHKIVKKTLEGGEGGHEHECSDPDCSEHTH